MSGFWDTVGGLSFWGLVGGIGLKIKRQNARRFEAAKADFSDDDYERFAGELSNQIDLLSSRRNKPVDLRTFVEAQPYSESAASDYHYSEILKRVLVKGLIDSAEPPAAEGSSPAIARYWFVLNDVGWIRKREQMREQIRPTTVNNIGAQFNGGVNSVGNVASPGAAAWTSQNIADNAKSLRDLARNLYADAEMARTPEEKERAVELADDLDEAVKAADQGRVDKILDRIQKFIPVATSAFTLTTEVIDKLPT